MAPKNAGQQNDSNRAIAEKVARVREVVRGNVKTDDIVLALYSFDQDVERTIQAFCDGDASDVLDDWVKPTKNKAKSKGGNKAQPQSQTAPVPVQPVAPAPSSQQNGQKPAPKANLPATTSAPAAKTNGHAEPKATAPKTATPVREAVSVSIPPNDPVKQQIHHVFESLRSALSTREKQLLAEANANHAFSYDEHIRLLLLNFGQLTLSGQQPKPQANGKPAQSNSRPTSGAAVPKAASPELAAIKHTTSQSSLSSSLADSGVNLSPTHKEERRVEVSGGISMSSDGLSADQLAAIQRTLQEKMANLGVDMSLLSGVPPPPRRPRKPEGGKKEGGGKQQKKVQAK